MGHEKILVVGQAPGRLPGNPYTGMTGRKISSLVGVDFERYFRLTERTNLLDHFPGKNPYEEVDLLLASKAKDRASAMVASGKFSGKIVLLLGRNVARAFGLDVPFLLETRAFGARLLIVIPHPSETCHTWNDPDFKKQANAVMERMFRMVDEGSGESSSYAVE